MAERDYTKRYEEIMRGAGEHKRILAQRALERERLFREKYNAKLTRVQRSEADYALRMISQIDREVAKITERMERTSKVEKRIELKAAIVHLRKLRDALRGKGDGNPRRKPPEAGLAVPAIPPKGPLPKQGGAQAPLDFEN